MHESIGLVYIFIIKQKKKNYDIYQYKKIKKYT